MHWLIYAIVAWIVLAFVGAAVFGYVNGRHELRRHVLGPRPGDVRTRPAGEDARRGG